MGSSNLILAPSCSETSNFAKCDRNTTRNMSVEMLHTTDTTSLASLKDQMDGLEKVAKMEAVFPSAMSMLDNNQNMYKRQSKKKMDRKSRFRTQPVTFTEITEVDEEMVEDNLMKTDKTKMKNRSSSEIRKSHMLNRSQSCRKPESIQRRARPKLTKGSEEDVINTDDEEEMLDFVNDDLNRSSSFKCQKGFKSIVRQ